jgi:hypothetical protein
LDVHNLCDMMLGCAVTFSDRGGHAAASTRTTTYFRRFIVLAQCLRRADAAGGYRAKKQTSPQ